MVIHIGVEKTVTLSNEKGRPWDRNHRGRPRKNGLLLPGKGAIQAILTVKRQSPRNQSEGSIEAAPCVNVKTILKVPIYSVKVLRPTIWEA